MRRALKKPVPTDLSYFNARVRSMRGEIMRKADYEPLMRLGSAEALVEKLKATRYGPFIEAASSRYSGPLEALSAALLSGLSGSLGQLWKIAPEGTRPLLKAVLSNWEVFDLKTIVRGLSRGVKREEIKAALIPAGEFDVAALTTLLSSKDVFDLVGFLDTWGSPYAAVLRPGLKEYQRNGRIIEMELSADLRTNRLFMEALSAGFFDGRIMREWLALRADLRNALTLLKIAGEGYAVEAASGFFIEGGYKLKRPEFIRLAGLKTKEELLAALKETGGSVVRSVLEKTAGADAALMEEAAEDAIKELLRTLSIIDPLSIALPASYIYMKVREIKNLRLLLRGAAFGIPLEELRRLLFYPV
ncbi:V/A-type H+/Na+-transporting ATPase subunit C [uncultured bacterium]|nr:V/A-type H+/Na+-transporting ATPase subunit C [uncultured bacterium]